MTDSVFLYFVQKNSFLKINKMLKFKLELIIT